MSRPRQLMGTNFSLDDFCGAFHFRKGGLGYQGVNAQGSVVRSQGSGPRSRAQGSWVSDQASGPLVLWKLELRNCSEMLVKALQAAKVGCDHGRPWGLQIAVVSLGRLQAPHLARMPGAASASKFVKQRPCLLKSRFRLFDF